MLEATVAVFCCCWSMGGGDVEGGSLGGAGIPNGNAVDDVLIRETDGKKGDGCGCGCGAWFFRLL